MTLPLPGLSGTRIALTQPEGADERWRSAVLACGALPEPYALLRLQPTGTPMPDIARRAHGLIFISPGAVRLALPALQQAGLPQPHQLLACPGEGSAAALGAAGFESLHPPATGDGLSLLQQLPHVSGQDWLLIRGEGGREELAQGLQARGAHVHDWRLYRREADPQQVARLLHDLPLLDAVMISSSETLRLLFAQAGESQRQRLQSKPLVVLHPRIAAAARELGVLHAGVCDSAAALPDVLARLLQHQRS